jgi:hypothetical protein
MLIEALRTTVARLTAGSAYQWGHHGQCNCGHLAQTVCKLPPARIHGYALERAGDWEALANAYFPTSGYPIDDVISELVAIGLTTDDLAHLEKLSSPEVLRRFPAEQRVQLSFRERDHVVAYLRAFADLLEAELEARAEAEIAARVA